MPPAPRRRRMARAVLLVVALAGLAVLLAPEGRLRCAEPFTREESPDGAWALEVCRVPMVFAMPGSSGDAPGWIVLRDRAGAIRGVSWLGMVQNYGAAAGIPTDWSGGRVAVPLVAELPLVPARGPVSRWWEDRLWRLRALLGLVSTDDDFH